MSKRISLILILIAFFSYAESQNDKLFFDDVIVGNIKLHVSDVSNSLNSYQLIPVNTNEDVEKVRAYLSTILIEKDYQIFPDVTLLDMLTNFIHLDEKTAYVFISPKTQNLIANTPYLKFNSDDVWFDIEKSEFDEDEFVSLWIFYVERNKDFRLILKLYDTRIETGLYSLLPETFKKGKPINEIHNDIKIIAYGEFFSEPHINYLPNHKEEYECLDLKSYTDSIEIDIGTMIGIKYELLGSDSTIEREYTFKIIHPEYKTGLQKGQKEELLHKYSKVGKVDYMIWEFTEDFELIPGTWTFQILEGVKVLYEKKFYLSLNSE